jgi:type VI secretion system secreted protein VgrG
MASTLPNHQNLRVHVASGDVLDVREFRVLERMSSLFEITLVVVCQNPDIDFEAVVGHEASFTMTGGSGGAASHTWTGLCNELEQLAVEEDGLSTYQMSLAPSLWLLTQRRNYRMFQQRSELDIALQLLAEWGIEPELRLTTSYKKRKYRVQYAESDFAFLCRMLEDAGISFFFERGEETRLILSDAPHGADARAPIPFRDAPTVADREHVTKVRVGRRIRPGKYTMRDHDYRKDPSFKLLAEAKKGEGIEERLERYHYTPGAFLFGTDKGEPTPHADDKGKARTDEAEAAVLAQKRLDAKRASAKTITFESNVLDLAPGVVVTFLDHPRSDLGMGKRLLIVEAARHGTNDGEWTTRCEARSADAPYRPALSTPKPKVSGVESATVVGPAGEEIHTDEFGRVRVHFHWDRESKMDDNSSCWIHVSQAWGGAGFGGMNLPRVGQEVIVDFLGGDPDRPIIVGRVYTNLQKTPYPLPASKTQSGWKSSSTGGTGGYNEMMFDDAAGGEVIRLQAEKDWTKLVKNDEDAVVGRDRTRLVKNDESVTIGNSRSKVVKKNEDVVIGKNHTKKVGANEREVTILNRIVSVGASRSSQVGSIDSVVAGSAISVMVSPPSEGESAGTSQVITHDRIVLSTPGGATLTMEGDAITLTARLISFEATEKLTALGKLGATLGATSGEVLVGSESGEVRVDAASNKLTLSGATLTKLGCSGGDVRINGGPMVKVNTVDDKKKGETENPFAPPAPPMPVVT